MGSSLSIVNDTRDSWQCKVGPDQVQSTLADGGFEVIPPGQSHRWGKMALSLWQQGTCIKTVVTDKSVQVATLYMRPIFSGATKDSNSDHSIQWWIDKWGTEKKEVAKQRLLLVEDGDEGEEILGAITDNAEAVPLGKSTVEYFDANSTNTDLN